MEVKVSRRQFGGGYNFRKGVAVNNVLCDDDDDGVPVFSSAVFPLLSPLWLPSSFSVDDEVLLFGLFRTLRTYNLPPSRSSAVSERFIDHEVASVLPQWSNT